MTHRSPSRRHGAAVGVALLALAGCSGSAPATGSAPKDVPPPAVTSTTQPSSFCRALTQLAELRGEPTDDDAARSRRIADIYESLVDDVPDTIRPDFEYVIATLRGQTPPTTEPVLDDAGGTATFDGEGYLTDETPGERVTNYINFACTGIENNPGPAPTDPP